MRALMCTALTGIDALTVRDLPVPEPGAGEVRIAVAAAGLNYPDLLMLSGRYQRKPPLPFVPGLEASGFVTALGPGVDEQWLGRRVMTGARNAFADVVVAPVADAIEMPAHWSLAQGAAFSVAARTAFHALVHRARLQAGECIVVHGASGGTGHMAVKIAKTLGAHVVATTGDTTKNNTLRSFGANEVVDATAPDVADRLKAACRGRGADVVFDPVGGPLFDASLKACAFGARVLIIGFVGDGPNAVRTNYALIKGLSILGVRAGEAARHDPSISASYRRDLPALIARADLRPHVGASYRLAEGCQAFRHLESRRFIGKIVLTI